MTRVVAREEIARGVAHGVQTLDDLVVHVEHAAVAIDGEAAARGQHAAVGGQREEARARERHGGRQIAVEVLIDAAGEEALELLDGGVVHALHHVLVEHLEAAGTIAGLGVLGVGHGLEG